MTVFQTSRQIPFTHFTICTLTSQR